VEFKIVTGYQGNCPYRELALANFGEYCERWGHKLAARFGNWLPEKELLENHRQAYVGALGSLVSEEEFDLYPESIKRKIPFSWIKHYLIADELRDCDWLVWLDSDCKIMNMTTPLESFLSDSFDLAVPGRFPECPVYAGHDHRCKYSPEGYETLSLGVMLIRNCDWSRQVFEDWWRSQEVEWREDRPFHCRMLGDNQWFSCHFMLEDPRRKRVKILEKEKIGYVHRINSPEQFIIHLYGSTEANRVNVLRNFEEFVIR